MPEIVTYVSGIKCYLCLRMGNHPYFQMKAINKFWGTTWKKFLVVVKEFKLIKPGDRLLALVSGGPDSTAMAWWLQLLKKHIAFEFVIAHFDHGLRADSSHDALFVKRLAQKIEAPFFLKKIPVKDLVKKEKRSLEDAGRFLRYREAERIAKRYGFNKVATAHTLDEQAESVLLNLIRGGSANGLLGARLTRRIRKGSPILLVRPLLQVAKKEVLDFLQTAKIGYRRDPTNRDLKFLRNRIRWQVLPKIAELNPRALEHLANVGAKLLRKG